MAGSKFVPCVGPSYQLADRKTAVQRAVNLYLRAVEAGGEHSQFVLASAPGIKSIAADWPNGRGSYSTGEKVYFVYGSTVASYYVDSAGVNQIDTLEPAIYTSGGPVGFKHSEDKLVIVDGVNGYVVDMPTGTWQPILSEGWRGSNVIEWMDGYFIAAEPDTNQFYISEINDPLTWNPLDFSSADAQPDKIVTMCVLKHELILFGSRSSEVWINTGNADFPFERYSSAPIDVGCVGIQAITRTTDSVSWIGQTERGRGYVYLMNGHQPVRISNRAVEEALAASTDISQADMWSYHVEGSEFIGVNAPGLDTTWVYDIATGQWHERGLLLNGEWNPWPAKYVAFLDGQHVALNDLGLVGLDPSVSYIESLETDPTLDSVRRTNNARERTWPHMISPAYEPMNFRSLELMCTTANSGNVTLEVSNDGGYTFGPALPRSLGTVGRFMQRVRWNWLGASRDRVFRLRCTDAVGLTIHGAYLDAS